LQALTVYEQVKNEHRVKPDEILYLVAVNAAGKLGFLSRARSIHADIIASGLSYENNEKILHTL
jgi:hypothetical protein